MTPLVVLAREDSTIGAGPLGLLLLLLMLLATFLLIRNMNARIKRLPESFDDVAPGDEPPADEERGPRP